MKRTPPLRVQDAAGPRIATTPLIGLIFAAGMSLAAVAQDGTRSGLVLAITIAVALALAAPLVLLGRRRRSPARSASAQATQAARSRPAGGPGNAAAARAVTGPLAAFAVEDPLLAALGSDERRRREARGGRGSKRDTGQASRPRRAVGQAESTDADADDNDGPAWVRRLDPRLVATPLRTPDDWDRPVSAAPLLPPAAPAREPAPAPAARPPAADPAEASTERRYSS